MGYLLLFKKYTQDHVHVCVCECVSVCLEHVHVHVQCTGYSECFPVSGKTVDPPKTEHVNVLFRTVTTLLGLNRNLLLFPVTRPTG